MRTHCDHEDTLFFLSVYYDHLFLGSVPTERSDSGSGSCSPLVFLPGQPDRGAGREPRDHGVRRLQVRHPKGPGEPR